MIRLWSCELQSLYRRPSSVGDHPEVVVFIGNRQYLVGKLNYDVGLETSLPFEIVLAIAAVIVIFILAMIVVLIAYRRNSTKHDRQMNSLKAHMDQIEMKVEIPCFFVLFLIIIFTIFLQIGKREGSYGI